MELLIEGLVEIYERNFKILGLMDLTMADKTIEEFSLKQGYNPYPLVRYTERADIAATHLLEGHVLIYVDTSPSVIITPTTIFHHMQHVEEYRQSPGVGTFIKMGTVFRNYFIALSYCLCGFYLFLEPSLCLKKWPSLDQMSLTNIPDHCANLSCGYWN